MTSTLNKAICKCAMKMKPIRNYLTHFLLLISTVALVVGMWKLLYNPPVVNNLQLLPGFVDPTAFTIFGTIISTITIIFCITEFIRPGTLVNILKNDLISYTILGAGILGLLYGVYILNVVSGLGGVCALIGLAIIEAYVFHVTQRCPRVSHS